MISFLVMAGLNLGVFALGPYLGMRRDFRFLTITTFLMMLPVIAASFSSIGSPLLNFFSAKELTGDARWDFAVITGYFLLIFWLGFLAGAILPMIGLYAAERRKQTQGNDE